MRLTWISKACGMGLRPELKSKGKKGRIHAWAHWDFQKARAINVPLQKVGVVVSFGETRQIWNSFQGRQDSGSTREAKRTVSNRRARIYSRTNKACPGTSEQLHKWWSPPRVRVWHLTPAKAEWNRKPIWPGQGRETVRQEEDEQW